MRGKNYVLLYISESKPQPTRFPAKHHTIATVCYCKIKINHYQSLLIYFVILNCCCFSILLPVASKRYPWFLISPGSHPVALHHIQFLPLSNTALLLHNYSAHKIYMVSVNLIIYLRRAPGWQGRLFNNRRSCILN